MKSLNNFYSKIDLKNNYVFVLFMTALFLALILIVMTVVKGENQAKYIYYPKLSEELIIDKVTLKSSDGVTNEGVDLPARMSVDKSYSFNFIVEKNMNELDNCISLKTQNGTAFFIMHDGKKIYEKTPPHHLTVPSGGKQYDLVTIPKELIGKELEITFTSSEVGGSYIEIPKLLVASENQIREKYLHADLINIFGGFALLVTAGFIFFAALFFIKIGQSSRGFLIAALFCIIMFFYISSTSWLVLNFLNAIVFSHYLKYMSLKLIFLPVILIYLHIFNQFHYYGWRVRISKIITFVLFFNLIVQWIVISTGLLSFDLLEKITLSIIIFSFSFITVAVFSLSKNKVKVKKSIVLSNIVLLVFTTSIIIDYLQVYDKDITLLILVSLTIFMMIHLTLAIKKYVMEYNLAIEDSFYSQLAYYDTLTSLSNRHEFEKTVKSIMSKEINFKNMHLIMLDMNNLKKINDNYGHQMGDVYLKEVGEILLELETKYNKLKAYRFGGDEFILLAYNKRLKELERIISEIESLSSTKTLEGCEYSLELAIGYSECTNRDLFNVTVLKDEADKLMYEDKARKKKVKNHEDYE